MVHKILSVEDHVKFALLCVYACFCMYEFTLLGVCINMLSLCLAGSGELCVRFAELVLSAVQ